jgi:hypothetical protein
MERADAGRPREASAECYQAPTLASCHRATDGGGQGEGRVEREKAPGWGPFCKGAAAPTRECEPADTLASLREESWHTPLRPAEADAGAEGRFSALGASGSGRRRERRLPGHARSPRPTGLPAATWRRARGGPGLPLGPDVAGPIYRGMFPGPKPALGAPAKARSLIL